jgi:hypothetical protein
MEKVMKLMKVSKQRVSLPNPNTLAPKPCPKASQQVENPA